MNLFDLLLVGYVKNSRLRHQQLFPLIFSISSKTKLPRMATLCISKKKTKTKTETKKN